MDKSGTYSANMEQIESANQQLIDFEQKPIWFVSQPEVGQAFGFFYSTFRYIETSLVQGIIRHSHYGEPTRFTITTKNSIYRVTDIRRNE